MKSPRKSVVFAVAGIAAAGMLLSGCSATKAPTSGKVSITVASYPPGSNAATKQGFQKQVAAFEKKNPDIKVSGEVFNWEPTTFPAQLAGGTLPTVFDVPFTDSKSLAENGQVADLTQWLTKLPYFKDINPAVLDLTKNKAGDDFGIPWDPYAMAISYNRDDFVKAGLDPDKPPTTWNEVEQDAKAISKALPGVAGYMQQTINHDGGWTLTTDAYSRGGRLETTAKNGKVTVNVDIPAVKQSLAFLSKLRWQDNAMGSNFLFDWGSVNTAFGAGQVAMYLTSSDVLSSLASSNGVAPSNYGVTTIPLTSTKGAGVLSGGHVEVANVKATDAQKAAAVKWIDFQYGAPQVDKAAAVTQAKTLKASKQIVGAPVLPIFNAVTTTKFRNWIKPFATPHVLANTAPFNNNIGNQTVVPEPNENGQDLYAALDPVVQAVLTQKNVDVDALLQAVNVKVQALIDASPDQKALK